MLDPEDLEYQVRFGGLGELEGDERTLSQGAAEHIADIAKADLQARYTDLDENTELEILTINAPNVAILKPDSDSEDSE